MSESIGVGGSWKTITGQWIGVGGAWKLITQKWVGVGGVWKLAYSALTVTCADVNATGAGFASSGSWQSDRSVSATPSGGSGSYTYSWTQTGGETQGITFATSANPQFSGTAATGNPNTATWEVTATDAVYGNSATDTITVTGTWLDLT